MAEVPETDTDEEDGTPGDGEAGEAKKGGLKKLALFAGLPVVIIALGGVAGALLFLGGDEDAHPEGEGTEVVAEAGPTAAERYASLHNWVRDIDVNIEGEDGSLLAMRLQFALVYEDPALTTLLESELIEGRLRTSFVEFLRTLRADDIYGSMGTFRIRAELLRRANLELAPHEIEDVLIPDLIIA